MLSAQVSSLGRLLLASKNNIKVGVPSRPTKTTVSKPPSPKAAPVKKQAVTQTLQQRREIPNAPATKGLQYKMPKIKGAPNAEAIQRRLKKKSPWYSSIVDPLHGADCKIPDETGVETGVLQIVQRGQVTSGGSGVVGARIISPYVNLQASTAGVNVQITNAASTGTSIAWGNGTLDGNSRGFEWDGSAEIREITNAHRIVSCAMYIQPEPSLSDNKGEITLFSKPFSVDNSPNYTDYMNTYKAVIVPVNNNEASKVLWYPFARQDWSFKSFIRTDGTTFDTDDDAATRLPYWTLGFVTSGLASGVTLRYTCVVNIEFVPKFNTLNVLGASPSPQDVTETDLVENWVQEMPVATPISQRQAASSPSAVNPSHDDDSTGFGMFFNVIKELAPLALSML